MSRRVVEIPHWRRIPGYFFFPEFDIEPALGFRRWLGRKTTVFTPQGDTR
jgi:hypothetical protein